MGGVKAMIIGVQLTQLRSILWVGAASITGNYSHPKVSECVCVYSYSDLVVLCVDRQWNNWNQYLHAHRAEGADDTYFTRVCCIWYSVHVHTYLSQDQLAPPGSLCFSRGMRVEAKDRKNPHLTCVATIADIQNGHLLIHFDGWSNSYDYWCLPNTTDIHPPMWASKHDKKLEKPKGIHNQLLHSSIVLSYIPLKPYLKDTDRVINWI